VQGICLLILAMREHQSGSTVFLSRKGPFTSGRIKAFQRAESELSQLNRLMNYLSELNANAPSKFYGQAERAISTRKLKPLLALHLEPIKQVVFLCPSFPLRVGRSHLEECFTLICIQRLSQPNFATQPCR
jgi:hypothetical protein